MSTRTLTQVRYTYEHKTHTGAVSITILVSVGLNTFVSLSADEKYLFLLCLHCPSSHVQHNDTSTNTRRRKSSFFLCLHHPSSHILFLVLRPPSLLMTGRSVGEKKDTEREREGPGDEVELGCLVTKSARSEESFPSTNGLIIRVRKANKINSIPTSEVL